ncbi:hypothetical protein ABZ669_26160 [Streptomyces hirsutus]|uniref:hypothetical protein n=1 Tax=Streptomyces hirsutus TaxID=35620 RepID=UPI0033D1EB49
MTDLNSLPLTAPLEPSPLLAVVATVPVVALLLAGWLIRQSRTRTGGERSGIPAVWVAALAAIGCTAYSADTSQRFVADHLDMASTAERAATPRPWPPSTYSLPGRHSRGTRKQRVRYLHPAAGRSPTG